jgi:site-specific recombinase XerD
VPKCELLLPLAGFEPSFVSSWLPGSYGSVSLLTLMLIEDSMALVETIAKFVFRHFGELREGEGCAPRMKNQVWFLDERKFLNRREQRALRRAAAERLERRFSRARLMDWFLVELGLESGLRISEMAALVHDNLLLHFARPVVWVRRGKGGKPRPVRVRRQFVNVIEQLCAAKEQLGMPCEGASPVLVGPAMKALGVRALQKAFSRLCVVARVQGHSVHHLRHTYASELYRASGKNLRLVQKQLGHARVTTTQVYADVFDEDATRAVERLYANG